MKISHVAIWAENVDRLKGFYVRYFGAKAGKKYRNATKGFESYFLNFESGARLEIMHMTGVSRSVNDPARPHTGLAHFAVSVGSRRQVDELTAVLKADGYRILDGPRDTGDGYYETVVLDAEGNRVEITE